MEWRERIGPIDWTIVEVPVDALPDRYGECDYAEAVIRIRAGLKPQIRAVTIWHERIHAMLYAAGENRHPERLVDALAHAIVAWERDKLSGTADGTLRQIPPGSA